LEAISEFPSTTKQSSPDRQSVRSRTEHSNPFGEDHRTIYYEKMTRSEQPYSKEDSASKQNVYMTMSMDKVTSLGENYRVTENFKEEKITQARSPVTEGFTEDDDNTIPNPFIESL